MGTTTSSEVSTPGLEELRTRAARAAGAVATAEQRWLADACTLAVVDCTDADRIAAAARRYAVSAAGLTYARAVSTMAQREVQAARAVCAPDDERPAPGGPASSYTTTDLNREPAD